MLTDEQAESIKQQLFSQIEKLPEEQRKQTRKEIEEMNNEELEEFVAKISGGQKEDESSESGNAGQPAGCIFCGITEGKVKSFKLGENKDNIAVLDINPLGKGQSLIIPRKHQGVDKIKNSGFSLAKKIAGKIKNKLKAESVDISTANVQGHGIINIIPTYKGVKAERKKASEEELILLKDQLGIKLAKKREKKVKAVGIERLEKAPRRIP